MNVLHQSCLLLLLAGCAPADPAWQPPDSGFDDLRRWWRQVDDPLLPHLIDAAQRASPTVARAAANIADARAARAASAAALLPALDLAASTSRGRADLAASAGTVASATLQAGWEIDLFGANRAGAEAAEARQQAAAGLWHDARISVATELARSYVEFRACEAHVVQAELDAASRTQTARLTDAAAAAGLRAPATAALARASAAQGRVSLVERRTGCDLLLKALVALTARDEPGLRRDLADRAARLPEPAGIGVAAVPAEVLARRPDIEAASSEVAAAAADAVQAEARRWPRLILAGSIGAAQLTSLGMSVDGAVWSIGPVAVAFPLFDGGARRAGAEAALARFEAAKTIYAARLREAIAEVERALATLAGTGQSRTDAEIAAEGFARSFRATAASYDAGAASLFELEDARRSLVAAQSALIDLQRERLTAWIALYRATGGGWTSTEP